MRNLILFLMILCWLPGCAHNTRPITYPPDAKILDEFSEKDFANINDANQAIDSLYSRLHSNNAKIQSIKVFIAKHRSKAPIKYMIEQINDKNFKLMFIEKVSYTDYMDKVGATRDELRTGILASLKSESQGRRGCKKDCVSGHSGVHRDPTL